MRILLFYLILTGIDVAIAALGLNPDVIWNPTIQSSIGGFAVGAFIVCLAQDIRELFR